MCVGLELRIRCTMSLCACFRFNYAITLHKLTGLRIILTKSIGLRILYDDIVFDLDVVRWVV